MGKTAFVFPGQGSQYVGMASQAFHESPRFNAVMGEASEACGLDLRSLCLEGPEEALRQTANQQPAVLAVSVGLWYLLSECACRPDVVAGHSLGEYSALVASGVLSVADGVWLVRQRGRLMAEAAEGTEGGMAAILGLTVPDVERACAAATHLGPVQVANLNCPGQTVISGTRRAVDEAIVVAKALGARRCVLLPVSGAFHSNLMAPVGVELGHLLQGLELHEPRIPVVMNYTADYVDGVEDIAALMMKQVSGAVRWEASVRRMMDDGVTAFVEVGPGKVLSGLIRKIAGPGISMSRIEDLRDITRLRGT